MFPSSSGAGAQFEVLAILSLADNKSSQGSGRQRPTTGYHRAVSNENAASCSDNTSDPGRKFKDRFNTSLDTKRAVHFRPEWCFVPCPKLFFGGKLTNELQHQYFVSGTTADCRVAKFAKLSPKETTLGAAGGFLSRDGRFE